MKRYDPDSPPESAEWLALDEMERIRLVEAHHRKTRIALPSPKAHATLHTVVENQSAMGLGPVVRAMVRLRKEGLSRHEALHAIGSIVAEHFYHAMTSKPREGEMDPPGAAQARYEAAVERLTAQEWRRRFGE